jgi:hypothetical protein
MNEPIQPDFITFDVKQREAFLSQVGNFTPAERELFHRLVKMWAPEISYASFFGIVSAESVSAKNDIESMMRKLRHARIGLLTTAIKEGVRSPQSLVLTNQDDYYFYQKLVEEDLLETVADITLPLPSIQTLQERNLTIPGHFVTETDYPGLAALYSQKEIKELVIFRIEARQSQLLLTSQTIKRFITVALAKMQNYLQNSNFLSWLAQMKNMALADMKKSIEARDPHFLAQFTKDILAHQDEIRQNRKLTTDDAFWTVIYFLSNFLSSQIEETKRRKAADEERILDMRTIAEQVKAESSFMMVEERFAELLLSYKKKYDKAFPEFRKEFEDKFLQPPERKSLPVLVHMSRFYIHQENVHPLFLMGLEKNCRELFAIYVHLMGSYIKNPAGSAITAFYTPDNFQNDIADHVKELDPVLHALLQRPNLVAEAIIMSLRKHKEPKSAEELKAGLSAFFHNDRVAFRDNSELFGLNLVSVFKLAFAKLSIIRQLVLKISGKYESLYKKFEDFIDTSANEPKPGRESKSDAAREEAENRPRTAKEEREAREARRQRLSAKPAAKEAKPAPKPDPKRYTKNERDDAWSQFQSTIKK